MGVEWLDYLGAARFEGADSAEFLQAQLSADIGALEPGGAGFACYCSPRGQVYGLLLVCRLENSFLVAGCAELLPSMLDRLRMFVFRSKVEFAMEGALRVYGLNSSEAGSMKGAFLPAGLRLGYLLDSTSSATPSAIGFKALEIDSHIAWLNRNTTEKFIPQMLGFERIGAVSFTKGCYPGQEIVARARYLGKVKRKPVVLAADISQEFLGGERVELKREDDWVNGTVIDSAVDVEGITHLFVIAPSEPEAETREFRYGGQVYRCATT